jgi:lipopolysaccharide export system protein LptA
VFSQKSVLELLPGSEKLGYNEKTGAHRLVGTVNFIYQGNTMYCDSAHYFDKSQVVRAYGNVHVTKEDINLYCDSLYYNGKTKKAKLWGHVRVRDLEYKLTTDTLEYDAGQGQGIYRHGGKIESISSPEVLTSRVGYFYPDTRSFTVSGKVKYTNEQLKMSTDTLKYNYHEQKTYFYGPTVIDKDTIQIKCERGWFNIETEESFIHKNAQVKNGGETIKGDTLHYVSSQSKTYAFGNVMYSDTSSKTSLFGQKGYSSEKENYFQMSGDAVARKQVKNDTLFVLADTLTMQGDTISKIGTLKGYHNVKLFNGLTTAKCDSIFFSDTANVFHLFYDPIVWHDNAQLSGDSLTVFLNDSIIDKVFIRNRALSIMEVDSGLYYNQIGGNQLIALFNENEIYKTDVTGNAATIFFPLKEEKEDSSLVIKRMGMNRLYASDLRFYLDGGEITGITYFDHPDGIFYPMDQIETKESQLKGFNWSPGLKPDEQMLLPYR